MRSAAGADAGDAGHAEFLRLAGKKFKGVAGLASTTRTFISKYVPYIRFIANSVDGLSAW